MLRVMIKGADLNADPFSTIDVVEDLAVRQALAGGVELVIHPDDLLALEDAEDKELLRKEITADAGDPLDLLGSTADCSMMGVIILAKLVNSIYESADLAAVQADMQEYKPLLDSFLHDLDLPDGDENKLLVPHREKGIAESVAKVKDRSRKVAKAIKRRNERRAARLAARAAQA